jgi:hypothetical protein
VYLATGSESSDSQPRTDRSARETISWEKSNMPADDIWEDDDNDNDEPTGSDLVKQLRKQLKETAAAKKAAEEELKTLRPAVRATQVSGLLKNVGVDAKYAKLVPGDLEATEDSLKAWAEEYGFVSQGSTTEDTSASSDTDSKDAVNDGSVDAQAAQWARIQSQASAAGNTSPDVESQQLGMLQAAASAAKGNPDLYFEYLTGKKPIPTA